MSSNAPISSIPTLNNILFATDFSPSSEAAIPVVRALAARFASTVHFVHVVAPEVRDRPSEFQAGTPPSGALGTPDLQRTDAEDEMQLMLAGDGWRGIPHTSLVVRGTVWKALASLVEERNIDLIILGTHGRRGLEKLVLGSTAEQVIRMAPAPVLTVGPHATQANQTAGAPVLFATDFSSGARYALRYAASWARANRSRLVLLHAVQPQMEISTGDVDPMPLKAAMAAELSAGAQSYARRQMAELIAAESLQELEAETIVQNGPAAELIVATARERKAGLIVMGADRAWLQSLAGHLPWTTASAILCEAPCPVITVRD